MYIDTCRQSITLFVDRYVYLRFLLLSVDSIIFSIISYLI